MTRNTDLLENAVHGDLRQEFWYNVRDKVDDSAQDQVGNQADMEIWGRSWYHVWNQIRDEHYD